MYKKNTLLKETAEKRLQAIREFTDLGSGYKIAMRDLEIRGAGNLLGHLHVGEGNRKLPGMSKGSMPWAEMGEALREINYNKCVVAEPFLLAGGKVGADVKVWRDLSNGADDERMDKYLTESMKFLKEKFVG